jgi:hypothetical protein
VTTWIIWDNDHRGRWDRDREGAHANAKEMISSKKTILSAYFSRTGFVSLDFLPHGQKYNSQFLIETLLLSLVANLSVCRPKLKCTDAHLHVDNAKPHNARLSIRKTEEYGLIYAPQPPDSLALALLISSCSVI